MGKRLLVLIAALALTSIAAAPAMAGDASLECTYALDLAATAPQSGPSTANTPVAGSFTSVDCARIDHAGSADTLSLVPGSGATTGTHFQALGPSIENMFAPLDSQIALTDGNGSNLEFGFWPAIVLVGRSGSLSANASGPTGYAQASAYGTATLTSCLDVAVGTCDTGWHLTGTFTVPVWHEL